VPEQLLFSAVGWPPAAARALIAPSKYGQCVPHSSAATSTPALASIEAAVAVCCASPPWLAQASASSSSLRP